MAPSKSNLPVVAGTMQTDPRSGGVKRSSGVNVLPSVVEAWAEVRDDSNTEVDWILIGYDGSSKTDMTLIEKGKGGMDVLSNKISTVVSEAGGVVFGGTRLFTNDKSGRFVHFIYVDEYCPAMKKGRTLMYKNGVFNALLGCDGEIEMKPGLSESEMGSIR
uniref:ADF-H domain-containing protein n=1 Tax=Pseudo-nitzschia australis TaxID=44445 RepID=A0A7S4AWU4_9STRA|mmetsp:Transcript_25697/g.56354  ORF Transcript_25697/g.56354 Transcript_25697/m.56354 type:complete len:161 (+) Transcript_25697:147-629(+)